MTAVLGSPRSPLPAGWKLVKLGDVATIIAGQRFIWSKGDIIALPPCALHEHSNTSKNEDAVLFSIQDSPVFQALGLYYEESLNENGATLFPKRGVYGG